MVWAELVEPASDGQGKELVGQARPLRFWRRIALRGSEATRAWPATREKVIVREIVKVRCKYCSNLFDVTLDKCPSCGAPP
ncbi:MAG: hypothetical protein OEW84_09425 [Aigarchaeota archaeon]|nr:hypothetical protein [Aigarchaeota archaeon]